MRTSLTRVVGYGLGLAILVLSMERHLLAGAVPTVPEIDGMTISAGLGLLAAGVLVLRSRRRSK